MALFFPKILSWTGSGLQKLLNLLGINIDVKYVLSIICVCCIVALLIYLKLQMGRIGIS